MSITGIPSDRTAGFAISRLFALVGLGLLLLASPAGAQIPSEFTSTPVPSGVGWPGFTDLDFLLGAFLHLLLAAALGAVIGYHPRRMRTADTLEEIEAQKVSIVYAVIGSLIGILVVNYGVVVGFVLFGIGGLIRFRSVMSSAQLTGQVIFVTLIGLTCGLDLPHVAVLATAFEFVLTFILEARITYKVDVDTPAGIVLSERFRVRAMPTLVVCNSRGEEIDRFSGYRPPQQYARLVRDYLADRGTPQALGIVTDVQTFLHSLLLELVID